MKEYNSHGSKVICRKEKIDNNWYYVIVWSEPTSWNESHLVMVYAYDDGSEMEYMHPTSCGGRKSSDLDMVAKKQEHGHKDIDRGKFVSQAINEAICTIEKRQQKREELETDVLAALEANKKVHNGIDYELEQEREES